MLVTLSLLIELWRHFFLAFQASSHHRIASCYYWELVWRNPKLLHLSLLVERCWQGCLWKCPLAWAALERQRPPAQVPCMSRCCSLPRAYIGSCPPRGFVYSYRGCSGNMESSNCRPAVTRTHQRKRSHSPWLTHHVWLVVWITTTFNSGLHSAVLCPCGRHPLRLCMHVASARAARHSQAAASEHADQCHQHKSLAHRLLPGGT